MTYIKKRGVADRISVELFRGSGKTCTFAADFKRITTFNRVTQYIRFSLKIEGKKMTLLDIETTAVLAVAVVMTILSIVALTKSNIR